MLSESENCLHITCYVNFIYLFDNLAMASFPSTTEVIKDLENSTASALYIAITYNLQNVM